MRSEKRLGGKNVFPEVWKPNKLEGEEEIPYGNATEIIDYYFNCFS